MAMLNFDATQVDPSNNFEPLPAGWYKAMGVESSIESTKAGDGQMLVMKFKVIEGTYINRTVITRFNIENANPQTKEIAWKDLSALCHAVGVLQIQDTQQLHGQPVQIKLRIKPADGKYDASNEVKGFRNINEAIEPVKGTPVLGGPTHFVSAQAPQMPPSAPTQAFQPAAQPWGQPQPGNPTQAAAPTAPWAKPN